ncbi:MAG: LLM class F420-dependent oxidoreductase [Chloroflexi bacterium]|nr:LLM class F420-dependent oxidoreductase [Chloroflexota bacterium]
MDIGITARVSSSSLDPAVLAKRAEELGFESFWLPEHPILPVNTTSRYGGTADGSIPASMADIGDPLIGLARASAATNSIKLGTAISLVPEHNPLLHAKQIATLDRVSNGRFLFGIGAGWLQEETEIMGGDFRHRWGQTREHILAMKELWTQEEAEFHGRFVDFPAVRCSPKPVQSPHPPVYLGGFAANVFKRVVEYGDGWMPVRVDEEQLRAGRATLDELADAAGRDPRSIRLMVCNVPADADLISRLESAGADRVTIGIPAETGEDALRAMEEIASAAMR